MEHIPGAGDTEAVAAMFKAVEPGGRLIITVPVDRVARDEFREHDAYSLGTELDPTANTSSSAITTRNRFGTASSRRSASTPM